MAVSSTIVTQYYTGIFRQAPSAAVSSAYQAMADAPAALNAMLSAANVQVDPIVRLYQTAFNRLPDNAGLTGWVVPFMSGQSTLQSIATGFTGSQEFLTLYPASMSNAQFVGALYWNILQRAGEDAGIQGWVNALNAGATRAQVLLGFSESVEFKAKIEPAVNNFLTNIANTPVASQGSSSLYTGTLFDQVDAPTTVYNLTTNPENISGSNITVNGFYNTTAQSTDSTLTTADVLTGTGGKNVLNITTAGTAGSVTSFNGALINGFQVINLRATANTGTIDLAAAGISGLTNFNAVGGGAVTVTNLNAGAAYGVGGVAPIAIGNQNVGYTALATSAVINLKGMGLTAGGPGVAITGAGLTSTTINSTGDGNLVGVLATAGTTVTINATAALVATGILNVAGSTMNINGAAAAVSIGTLSNNVVTLNAAGLTAGGLTMTMSASTTVVVTGGGGNDTITTGSILTTGSVDAGTGTADTLVVATAAHVAGTTGAKYTNFEILQNNDAAANVVASSVAGITSVNMNATTFGGFTGLSAAQALRVTNLKDNTASAVLALTTATGTSDVLTVNLTNATSAAASADLLGVTVTGFETVNIVSNTGGAADTSSVSFAATTDLATLNLSGAAPIKVDMTNVARVGGTAVNASTLSFVGTAAAPTLEISGNLLKGSSVVGSGQIDKITTTGQIAGGATDFVTYDAGAGNDTIISTIAAINNVPASGFGSVKIDGGAGTDVLQLASGTLVDANFQYITNIESIVFNTANAIVMTTGANFNTNFATNGVSISDIPATGTKGASNLNISNFTGNVTVGLTQAGAGADTDSFIISTGTGADTVNLTTTLALKSTTNAISTGAGKDTVTVVETVALDAAGVITYTLGTGADSLTLSSKASKDVIVQTMGDSVAATSNTFSTLIADGNTITFGNGVDVITGFTSGALDKIDADVAGAVTAVTSGALLASTAQTGNYAMRGNFASGVFTLSATGADTLVSLGKAGTALDFTNTTDYVVLVGVTAVVGTDFI